MTEPHYETLELRVPEEERRFWCPYCAEELVTLSRWKKHQIDVHNAPPVEPSRRWIYLAVLFTALLIVVIAQLASAPSGASEPPGTAPALRGAPHATSEGRTLRDERVVGAPFADTGITSRAVPPVRSVSATTSLRGYASWYDVASGHAAAGPLLRTGDWRGRAVTVCAGSACIVTRLTDFCQCGSRHGIPTLIDLARSDFARLASPSQGVVLVTVRGATLPATDAE